MDHTSQVRTYGIQIKWHMLDVQFTHSNNFHGQRTQNFPLNFISRDDPGNKASIKMVT
jgi:hypothetical protein